MRRVAAILGAVTVLTISGPAQPAGAAVVVSGSGLPAPLAELNAGCSVQASGSLTHVNGPGQPPLGSGSLEVQTGQITTEVGVREDFSPSIAGSSLTAFDFSHDEPSAAPAQVIVEITLDRDGTGTHQDGLVNDFAPSLDAWAHLDALTAAYYLYPDHSPSNTQMTYAGYLQANPSAKLQEVDVLFSNDCNGSGGTSDTGYLDALSIGVDNATTTYDFENQQSVLAISLSATTITAGQSLTVRGRLTSQGAALAGRTVQLWAKPYPATSFHQIGTATSSDTGALAKSVHPLAHTVYQWRLPATADYAPNRSTTKPVQVHTRLTKHVSDTTLHQTQNFVMTGTVLPKRVGRTVSLLRVTSQGTVVVQKVKVASDGTYAFDHRLPSGADKVYAHIGAGDGDLAGRTAAVTVHVA